METQPSFFFIGIGVAIIIFILEKTVKTMPFLLVILGYAVSAILLSIGFLMLFGRYDLTVL